MYFSNVKVYSFWVDLQKSCKMCVSIFCYWGSHCVTVFLFRVVKEEISDDNAKLPCFNGRVVSWVSTFSPIVPNVLVNQQLQQLHRFFLKCVLFYIAEIKQQLVDQCAVRYKSVCKNTHILTVLHNKENRAVRSILINLIKALQPCSDSKQLTSFLPFISVLIYVTVNSERTLSVCVRLSAPSY